MRAKVLLLIICLLVLGGYASTAQTHRIPHAKELPQWVQTPPQEDTQFLYAVSIERDYESALGAALNNIASQLGVTLASSFTTQTKTSEYFANSLSQSTISAEVAKIYIADYEVLQTQKISYDAYALLVRSDKNKLYEALTSQLILEKNSIEKEFASLAHEDSKLLRYNAKALLAGRAHAMMPKINAAAALESSFDKTLYTDFVAMLNESFIKEQSTLRFRLQSDEASGVFLQKLVEYLTQKSLRLGDTTEKNTITIKLATQQHATEGLGVPIVNVTNDIALYEHNGVSLGGKRNIFKVRKSQTEAQTLQNASLAFETLLQDKGLQEVLGFPLEIR